MEHTFIQAGQHNRRLPLLVGDRIYVQPGKVRSVVFLLRNIKDTPKEGYGFRVKSLKHG